MAKTIVITGVTRGIGRGLAGEFDRLGHKVIGCGRSNDQVAELQTALGQAHDFATVNVTDDRAVADWARRTLAEHGAPDLLINNAGFWLGKDEHYGRCDDARWMEEFRVHMFGTMAMCESFVQQVAASKRKLIVNISSGNGSLALENGIGDYPYNTSKAGLNLITKGLAADLKQRGITVVCFTPGFVATDMSGPDADLTPHESVSAMRAIIDTLGPEQTGTFLRYNGETVPW